MNRAAILIALALISGDAATQSASKGSVAIPEGFYPDTREVGFEDIRGAAKKPPASIPKAWRFVGVSNGEKPNSNILWFQDAGGNIYLVRGASVDQDFVLAQRIEVLRAK